MEIWLRQEGVEYGPYTLEQVKEYIASGEFTNKFIISLLQQANKTPDKATLATR